MLVLMRYKELAPTNPGEKLLLPIFDIHLCAAVLSPKGSWLVSMLKPGFFCRGKRIDRDRI